MLLLSGTDKGKSDAAAALGNLAVNTELRASILEIPRVLYGLRCMLMEGSERHAGEAACCLQNLAVTTIDHKLRIAATEDLLYGLVKLMLNCERASQFQEDACSALLNLVVGCSENKKAVSSVDGVMEALQRCLETGSQRAKEHGAAVVQNLTFNSHANRMAVLAVAGLLAALSSLVVDIAVPRKASEYAAACMASLARTREGAIAVVRDQGTVEGLILMAEDLAGSGVGSRKASISALQTLTQTPEAAALLLRSSVPARCFLPVLRHKQADSQDESGRRIVVQAAIGMAYLSSLDTRLLDLIPSTGVDVLISTLAATVRGERGNTFKYKPIDLLIPLNLLASHDENKRRLHKAGLVDILIEILHKQDVGRDLLTDIEAIKLCWHLSFLPACKEEMLESSLLDVLAECTHINGEYEGWVLGLGWQLGMLLVHVDAVATQASQHAVSTLRSHIVIIADQIDGQVSSVVAENVEDAGHGTWPDKTCTNTRPVKMTDFVMAVNEAKLALIILSPSCELSPCCRSQITYIKETNLPYLCLNVGSAHDSMYVEHGYLEMQQLQMGSSMKCTPAMFQGQAVSAFNGIVDDFLTAGVQTWTPAMWLNDDDDDLLHHDHFVPTPALQVCRPASAS